MGIDTLDKKTSNKITWTMFVCSVIILLRHSSGYGNYKLDMQRFLDISVKWLIDTIRFDGIFNVALPVFFFFSGFLFYKNFGWNKVLAKCQSRVRTLCIPYLFWNTVWMLFVAGISFVPEIANRLNQVETFDISFINIVKGVLLHKYNPIFWYVLQLIVYVMLSPCIYVLIKNKYLGVVALVISFINDVYGIKVLRLLGEYVPIRGLFYYLVGAYMGVHFIKYLNIHFSFKASIIAGGAFLVLVLLYPIFCKNRLENMLITIGEMVTLWIFMDALCEKEVHWWTGISFYIYSIHYYIQLCVNKILYLVLPHKTEMILVNFIVGSAMTIAICILTAKFLMEKQPKLWNVITGNR